MGAKKVSDPYKNVAKYNFNKTEGAKQETI